MGGGIGPAMVFDGGSAEAGMSGVGGGSGGSGGVGIPHPFDVRVVHPGEGRNDAEVYLPPKCFTVNGTDYTSDIRAWFSLTDDSWWYRSTGVPSGTRYVQFKVKPDAPAKKLPGPRGLPVWLMNRGSVTISDIKLTYTEPDNEDVDNASGEYWQSYPLYSVEDDKAYNLQGGALHCVAGLTGDVLMCSVPYYDAYDHQLKYVNYRLAYHRGVLVRCEVHEPEELIAQAVPETVQVINCNGQ